MRIYLWLSHFMTKNTGDGPRSKRSGCQTRTKYVGAGPRVNTLSLNNNLCRSLLVSHFLSNLWPISFRSLLCTPNPLIFTPISLLRLPLCKQRMWSSLHRFPPFYIKWYHACDVRTRRGRLGSCRWQNVFEGVRAKLFWRAIYFSKPRPDTVSTL